MPVDRESLLFGWSDAGRAMILASMADAGRWSMFSRPRELTGVIGSGRG
ncbi:MAG TPA: hypothetical protein VGN81_00705 [Pseudonocardiaceae bacterium]